MFRAFVTGGSGFVGRNLIAALRARGTEVRALARSEAAAKTVRELGAEAVEGDLNDNDALRSGMEGCDAVIHSAAYVEGWGRFEDFYTINVTGTECMLAAARSVGISRFVHISTEAVLVGGPPIVNADETRPRPERPIGLYPLTKGLAEERVLANNSPEMATVIVRPRFIWGKDDTSVLRQLVTAVKKGKFMWFNGGRYLTSTCHVSNVCEGAILAAERGRGGEIYFLTDGEPVEVRSFLTALLRTQGLDPGERSLPRWLAGAMAWTVETAWLKLGLKGTPPITRTAIKLIGEEVTVNDAKARRELGYKGAVTREAGLAAMTSSLSPQRHEEHKV
jgi:nucleoside-diphosphate-sugar epimerase